MKNRNKTNQPSVYVADGRCGRATYIAWNFLITFIMFVCFAIVIAIYWSSISVLFTINEATPETADQIMNAIAPINAFGSLINFIFMYFMFVFSIKRLHDFNKSGWFSLFNLIPIVNLFFIAWLSMNIGDEGRNSFGDPRPTKGWEYALAWVSIIFTSLIGIGLIIALVQIFKFL